MAPAVLVSDLALALAHVFAVAPRHAHVHSFTLSDAPRGHDERLLSIGARRHQQLPLHKEELRPPS